MLWILLRDATQTEWDPSRDATFVEEMGSEEMVVEMDFLQGGLYVLGWWLMGLDFEGYWREMSGTIG
jgi:hypothetical protein